MKAFRPHAIHISTEGPLGLAMWRYCRHRDVPFTTSYHTRYRNTSAPAGRFPWRSATPGCVASTTVPLALSWRVAASTASSPSEGLSSGIYGGVAWTCSASIRVRRTLSTQICRARSWRTWDASLSKRISKPSST